jgi:hypothetical protein
MVATRMGHKARSFCVVSASRMLTYIRTLRAPLLLTPQNSSRHGKA